MTDLKGLVIAVEAGTLLLLGVANLVTGRYLGAGLLIGLALLAGLTWRAVAAPRRGGSIRRQPR